MTSHLAKNITQTAGVTNIVLNNVFKLIPNQATMRKNKSLYDCDLIKFDSISGEIKCTSKIDALNFEVGSLKSEVGSWKLEVGSRKSEVGSRKSEVGSRKSEVGSRKSEVGSRKSEVGSRKSLLGFRTNQKPTFFLLLMDTHNFLLLHNRSLIINAQSFKWDTKWDKQVKPK